MKVALSISSLLLTLLAPLSARESLKSVTFQSLYRFAAPQELESSPDGRQILYTISQGDIGRDSYSSALWLMDANGSHGRQLRQSASSAHWQADGKAITFIANEGGSGQLFRLDLANGRTEQLTRIPEGISDYVWLPDGSGILCSRPVLALDASPEYAARQAAAKKEQKHSGMVYDRLLFRPYSHWDDGTVSHVFHCEFASGELTDLTPGPFAAPTSHLGGTQDLAISPDGRTVAYTCNTDPVKAISTNNDVFLVNRDGTGTRRLTTGKGNDVYPVFSPDGRYLAYTEMATPGYESEQKDLILVDLKTDQRVNLTIDLDLSVGDIIWSRRSDSIFITCKEKGFDALYRIDLKDQKPVNLLRGRIFSSISLAADEKSFLCITSALDRPAEIARFDLVTKTFTALTHLADEFVRTHALAKSEVVWFKGALGDDVMAFLTLPEPFDPAKKYPVVFLFHGGPEGDWDGGWSGYVGNVNHFAAEGYVVVKLNVHGAASYGRKFLEAILNNWGRVDQDDVLKCLDHLCATRPYIDGQKIGAVGRSYGGFLVNWLNGNSNRFSCFVSVDGLFDQAMCYYACDELWFPEHEFGGTPLERREEYVRASPSTYASNFKTPTLVMHGGRDYRVDLSQGIAMFTALQRQGVPSKFIFFPDEPHYFHRLQNWQFAYEEQFAWLGKYLKNK